MALAEFIETPRFTRALAYGYRGGPGFRTDRVVLASGHERRRPAWQQDKGLWTIARPLADRAALDELLAYFRMVHAGAIGFRFYDWLDYYATQAQGRLGVSANATGVPTYQMHKRYSVGGVHEQLREIRKPFDADPDIALVVYRNGIAQTAHTHYTLDTTTGRVTWAAELVRNIVAVTQANPGKVTTSSAHGLTTGWTGYLAGISGMTPLNARAVTITVVDPDEFTIGIDTSAFPAYTSGGSVSIYPQPGETIAWSGPFDVPVCFGTDQLAVEIRDKEIFFADGLPIREIRV